MRYENIPWDNNPEFIEAWKNGRTGIPIVDAGIRQMVETGWMHNRLRMITAMFLSKNLLVDWKIGEEFFMKHLIDGDIASNNGGWQWSASTGTDAAPYFRIMNPETQSLRFDETGEYIRKYVKELRDCPSKEVHMPSNPEGLGYVEPIVDLKISRQKAIDVFGSIKKEN
jgi:deoxyribodipyrimidine photo-lyase